MEREIILNKILIVTIISSFLVILACGGGAASVAVEFEGEEEPTATSVPPTTAPESTATTAPEPTATTEVADVPEPTATPVPTATNVPEPTATATPTPTPTPTATPTPVPTATPLGEFTVINSYGYSLGIDGTVDVDAIAWLGGGPDQNQGLVSFRSDGTAVILIWQPLQGQPLAVLTGLGLGVLQASQPTTVFTGIAEGVIDVKDRETAFGGFAGIDSGGTTIGGGLVGAWACEANEFILILTGADSTLVQIRFDRLLDNFDCVAR